MPNKNKNTRFGSDRAPASSLIASVEVAKNEKELGAMVAVNIDGNEIKVPFGIALFEFM